MLTLATLLIFILTQGQGKAEEVHIVPGAFKNELASPIFYTSFIPIIQEFATPKWTSEDLRLTWRSGHSTTCVSSDAGGTSWTNAGCPSAYHYNSILASFFGRSSWENPGSKSNTFVLSSSSAPEGLEKSKVSCDEILPHFTRAQVGSEEWRKYWEMLSSCPIGAGIVLNPSTKFANIDVSKLSTMLDTYYSRTVVNLNSYSNYASYMNAYSAYQAVALIDHSVQMSRWRDAVTECESSRLPRSLVDETTWASALTSAWEKVTKKHFNLTVSETDKYFSLPLTDCIVSKTNGSYMIRTLVPLIPSRSAFKLVELKSIPFAQDFNGTASTNLICTLEGIEGRYIFDEFKNDLVAKTECKSLELCFIPDPGTLPILDPCVAAVFENNTETIRRLCKSRCVDVPTKQFPFFRRLSSNKYAVAGGSGSKLEIFLNCHAIPYKVITPNETGAMEITLPCHCKIAYQSEELHSYQPCGDKLTIRYIQALVVDEAISTIVSFTESGVTSTESIITSSPESKEADFQMQVLHLSTYNQKLSSQVDQLEKDNTFLWAIIWICLVMTLLVIIGLIWVWKTTQGRIDNLGQSFQICNDRVIFQNSGKGHEDPIMLLH